MRRKQVYLLQILVILWVVVLLVLLTKQPSTTENSSERTVNNAIKKPLYDVILKGAQSLSHNPKKLDDLAVQVESLESKVHEQSSFYRGVLNKLYEVSNTQHDIMQRSIAVLLISCNREAAVRRSLDLLLKYRPSQQRFPITVSQDCGHQATKDAILSYGDQVTLIQQPDLSVIDVPIKEKKFRGYFYIARHYKWALDHMFFDAGHDSVIIVEDDLDISPDFFDYFSSTHPLLKADQTLWCVSAWNDNGKGNLVDISNGASKLYRTDFFPGLGWMLTKDTWDELSSKWPKSYWDDWVRAPEQRKERACIRPEISRTRTFGKKGVSNGLFFEKHLKFIHLNSEPVTFSAMNLTYLLKPLYDDMFDKKVQAAEVVSLVQLKTDTSLTDDREYRIIYHTKDVFKKTTRALGLMDDFKAGVPRTGYKGVVSFMHNNKRVYLAPNNNWKGYDPAWS